MGHNKENKKTHKPEVPDARFVITTEDRSQPIELHGLMNRPTCEDGKKSGGRDREISETLKGVVFCVEAGMRPTATR